jgi:hypothetical protein
MHRTNPEIDIILDILKAMRQAKPASDFIKSLYEQYCERGGLSKKQLEGLHDKASKTPGMHTGKLATLQAIIMKKHTNHKSVVVKQVEMPVNDAATGQLIAAILEKYPQHKRVLFLKLKFDKRELLTATEVAELEKFNKLLLNSN